MDRVPCGKLHSRIIEITQIKIKATGADVMKQYTRLSAAAFVCALPALPHIAAAQTVPPAITTPDKIETRIGTLEFKDGAPSAATAEKVLDSLNYVRGVDAFMNSFSGASAYAILKGF